MVQQIAIIIHTSGRIREGLRGAAELLTGRNRVRVFLLDLQDAPGTTWLQQRHRISKDDVYAVDVAEGVSLNGLKTISLATMVEILKQVDHIIPY